MGEDAKASNNLDPKTVVGECLEALWKLPQYLKIVSAVQDNNFQATPDFQRQFNDYFRVRQKNTEWYKTYYNLMEKQKKEKYSFKELLEAFTTTVEPSFCSKLLAVVDCNNPIWDQQVLKSLDLYSRWEEEKRNNNRKGKIEKAVKIYESIKKWYENFLQSEEGRQCVKEFDTVLPEYAKTISDVKKVDFMLKCKGELIDYASKGKNKTKKRRQN